MLISGPIGTVSVSNEDIRTKKLLLVDTDIKIKFHGCYMSIVLVIDHEGERDSLIFGCERTDKHTHIHVFDDMS